jgi:hypothetical protein
VQTVTEIAIERAHSGIFTRNEASVWVDDTGARLDALLKRAAAAGEIIRIRRGLFCLASRYRHTAINLFFLAQRIHGPSYISLESSLAHHGWIPEAVYTVANVSLKRSRLFDTPMGRFSYTRIPQAPLFAGVERYGVQDSECYFLASPLKALADYVYVNRLNWNGLAPVLSSLRVEEAELASLTGSSFDTLSGVYRSGRVCRFLTKARRELGL